MHASPSRGRHRARPRRGLPVVVAVAALLAAPAIVAGPTHAAPTDITTVVGGGNPPDGIGDGLPARQASLLRPWGIEEVAGELYISEDRALTLFEPGDRVRRVNAAGIISTFAGGGNVPRDGGPATNATLDSPQGVWVAPGGALYVTETRAGRVRRIEPGADGVVTGAPDETIVTVAGNGTSGFSGDGGPATSAQLRQPLRAVLDHAGNLFIADADSRRVRRVSAGPDGVVNGGPGEIITTAVGNGTAGNDGDGGPASAAQVNPRGMDFDAAGNLYIADPTGGRIRRVTPGADGLVDGDPDDLISTFVVLTAPPEGVDVDPSGALYVTLVAPPRVVRVDPGGNVTPVAGTGVPSQTGAGDGGPALAARMVFPFGVTLDPAGNVYVADPQGSSVRRIVPGPDAVVNGGPGEIITTFAGTGSRLGLRADGGPATAAVLVRPSDVATGAGGVYIADSDTGRIRRVDASGIITTVAGGGVGDGLLATQASLSEPRGIDAGPAGVFIADCGNQRVRRVDAAGFISTFAQVPGPASCPSGIDVITEGPNAGAVYIADAGVHQILRADGSGNLTVIAGTGTAGFSGDNGPATAAQLNAPAGIFVDGNGDIYVADTGNNRVRRIAAATGVITTVAGDGRFALGNDHVPATSASIAGPTDLVRDQAGNLVVTDAFNRIRRIGPDGIITTIAGNGFGGFTGDGGPAERAVLNQPTGIDVDAAGNLFFTDQGNNRVRRIEAGVLPPSPNVQGCGAVITQNTELTADIGPCPGDGLVIGANNVTLDLKGHRILGVPERGHGVGIRIQDRTGVVVKGGGFRGGSPRGTVTGFDAGVVIIGGSSNRVTGLTVEDNVGPTNFDSIFGDGIGVFFSPGNAIDYNIVRRNGIYDNIAVLGIGSDNNTVHSNTVEGASEQGVSGSGGIGIVINAYLDDSLPREIALTGNRVSFNLVRNNEASGISAIGLVRSVISENTVLDNGLVLGFPGNGIAVQPLLLAGGDGSVAVMRNQVHGNARNGIEITSRSNVILNNDASHNNKKPTFSQRGWDLRDTDPNCSRNTWSGNTWGTGGFTPPCTTAGGQEAPGPTAAKAAETTARNSRRAPTPPVPLALTPARPHPPYPG